MLQLAQRLLDAFGGLTGLLHAAADDLQRVKGLGPAKRAEIAAVIELARRSLQRELTQRPVFDAPAKVKDYLRLQLGTRDHEVFACCSSTRRTACCGSRRCSAARLTQTSVYPREVVKRALELGAAAVVLAHNHPSGAAEPSRADEYLTQTLKSALLLVDVRVLDHLVVGQADVVSFAERGLL